MLQLLRLQEYYRACVWDGIRLVMEAEEILTSLHVSIMLGHIVRADSPQKLDIVITVKFCHLLNRRFHRSLKLDHKH